MFKQRWGGYFEGLLNPNDDTRDNVISFSTIDVYIITCRTFTLNMIHVLKFVSFSYIMYLVLRHVGGSRDSGTGCALVGVSRYNFTNVYFCIMFYIYIE